MGGGHVSRPDFGMPQPDPACPLTEFYLLLQHALDAAGSFALPALYARVQAPARWIDPDEAREYLTLSPTEREGDTRLLAPGNLQLLYSTLHVAPDGAPAALLLTGECVHPHHRGGAAAAALCVGGPAAACAGCACGAGAAADHAGCGAHRCRPRSAGPEAGAYGTAQALAASPEGGYLSGRAGGPAAKGLPSVRE